MIQEHEVVDRWVLAFDSSCGSCRRLSDRIEGVCVGRLETIPLASPEVTAWRQATLGEDPAWEPALFRVTPESVRAWTGRSMVLPLLRHLGLASSLRLTYALGSLRDELAADHHEGDPRRLTRKRFLQLSAGTVIAGTLIVRGQLPAYAADPVSAWVRANADRLPTTYDELISYPLDYRRGIYRQLTPTIRSALWSEQFDRYRDSHPDLTADQSAVLEAARFAATPAALSAFRQEPSASDVEFHRRAQQAFGDVEAASLFATLGPTDVQTMARREASHLTGPYPDGNCRCSTTSDWCGRVIRCRQTLTCKSGYGCGDGWLHACVGICDS